VIVDVRTKSEDKENAINIRPPGSMPTAICEYVAPTRSKTSPAYTHSLILGKPGISIAITPSILAMPRNILKYGGGSPALP
jgi:hypothetical protein